MRGRTAFTLLELLIVLTVATVLLAYAAPRVDLGRYKLDAAARQVEGVLQQAQRFAIQRQQDVVVSFDTTRQEIHVLYDANNNRSADLGERQTTATLMEGSRFVGASPGITGIASPAVAGQTLTTVAGNPAIIFRRDGASSSNINIYLGSSETPPAQQRALSIVQSIGRAQLYRRAGAGWKREGI